MATFGQGINPQLGAIDYSPILRGSMAGAQMAAQGSQMIGQGLANLGQEIGQGVQKYFKEQEENTGMMGNLTATNSKTLTEASKDPRIAKALEGLKVGKSPKREDLIYATAKIANLEKNEMREYQRFIQDTEKARIEEQKRVQAALPSIFAKTSPAKEALGKGTITFAQLAELSPDAFKEQAPDYNTVLSRALENKLPIETMTALGNQMYQQGQVLAKQNPKPSFKTTVVKEMRGGKPTEVTYNQSGQEIAAVPIRSQPANITFGAQEPGTMTVYDPETNTATVTQVGVNPKAEEKRLAKISAGGLLDEVTADYGELQRMGAIRDSDKSAFANIGSYFSSSKVGQEFGKAMGTQEQVVRDKINQAVPLLIQEFKNATGMTAAQMNSDADVRLVKEAVGNPSTDIQVALATMRRLQNRMGSSNSKPNNSSEAIRKEFGL